MIKTLNKKEIFKLLENNYIGYLSYIFKSCPYVIPITYYFDQKNNAIICYSDKGQKIIAMRKNDSVSLVVCEIGSVNNWQSVLVHGNYQEFKGSDAKNQLHQFSLGIKDLILKTEHKDSKYISDFSSKIYTEGIPVVFRININEITGRERRH